MRLAALLGLWACAAPPVAPVVAAAPAEVGLPPAPKLVVVLVIDQLRADHLLRFHDRLLPGRQADGQPGGFRALMDRGAWYPYAEHRVAQAMTCPGHSVVLTGAWPARTGIPLNTWFETGKGPVYCAADEEHGRSPRNLVAPTVGDALKLSGAKGQVISLSIKDRAAIMLGGHGADATVWWDRKGFGWRTSTFYATDARVPGWAQAETDRLAAARGTEVVWAAPEGPSRRSIEPNQWLPVALEVGTTEWLGGPPGVEITLDLALAAVEAESLGQDDEPDVLAISFSGFDGLGHWIGPHRREMEALLVEHDRALARFFGALDQRVGLDNVVIALTGDHGVTPAPEVVHRVRLEGGYIDEAPIQDAVEVGLVEALGPHPGGGPWVLAISKLNIWLDDDDLGPVEEAQAEDIAAAIMGAAPGMSGAITEHDVLAGRVPDGAHGEGLRNQWVPGRSGDVIGVPRPFFAPGQGPPDDDRVRHLTHYNYDRLVPLVLAGPGVAQGRRPEAATVADLAPTLSWLLGISPPALSEGRVLGEALELD